MDKESLEKRIVELQKELDQVRASGNAIIGAIQDCEYWLARLASTEETALPEATGRNDGKQRS